MNVMPDQREDFLGWGGCASWADVRPAWHPSLCLFSGFAIDPRSGRSVGGGFAKDLRMKARLRCCGLGRFASSGDGAAAEGVTAIAFIEIRDNPGERTACGQR